MFQEERTAGTKTLRPFSILKLPFCLKADLLSSSQALLSKPYLPLKVILDSISSIIMSLLISSFCPLCLVH